MHNRMRLPLPGGRNSIPSPLSCLTNGLLIFLCLAGVTASAETPLRNSFDSAEMKLMGETNLDYTACLQQDARENLASSPDVRVITGNAVQACEPVLTALQARLNENGRQPRFLHGGDYEDEEPGHPAPAAAADDGEIRRGGLKLPWGRT